MLVISGADLVGKSTFAAECTRLLQGRGLNHVLHHLSRVPQTWSTPDNYAERMCTSSVWDRFHLDELVYRQLDDRRSSMTPLTWDLTEAHFRLHCGYQVVLWADEVDIRARYAERGDPVYPLDHILRVNEIFFDAYDRGYTEMRGHRYPLRVKHGGMVVVNAAAARAVTAEAVVDDYCERLAEFLEVAG